jgi:hypothetical protein
MKTSIDRNYPVSGIHGVLQVVLCSYCFPQAVPGDYVSKVAYLAGMSVKQLLLDNIHKLPDLDKALRGQILRLCNIDPRKALTTN